MQSETGQKKRNRGSVIFWLLGIAVGVAAASWAAPHLTRCLKDGASWDIWDT
jgi:hypothetical protein